jgi:hypothetical protein
MLVTRSSQLVDTSTADIYYFLAQEEGWNIVDLIATTDSLLSILTALGVLGGATAATYAVQRINVLIRSQERANRPVILPPPFKIRREIGLRMIVGFFMGAFLGWVFPHSHTIDIANNMLLGWLINDELTARSTTAILGAIVTLGLGLASANRILAMLIGALIGISIGIVIALGFSLPTVWIGPVIFLLAIVGLVGGRKISPREEGETNRGGVWSIFAPILRLAFFVGLVVIVGIGFITALGGQVETKEFQELLEERAQVEDGHSPASSASMVAFVTTNETNIRSGAGTGYRTLALAYQGDRVMLQGRTRQAANGDTWSQVEFEGKVGWVHHNLLRCNLSRFCGQ